MDSAIIGQLRMKAELARAVASGEFVVYYQPTVELANAGWPASRRWCGGSTPSAGWSRRWTSSRWPSRPG